MLGIEPLEGSLSGSRIKGVSYGAFGEPPQEGETCLANTLGPEMGLGTGGMAVVMPRDGGESPENRNHFVKLPYTPLQSPATSSPNLETLSGVPVVALPLHSHLVPACAAAAALYPGVKVSFVWQEGGSLAVPFSRTVGELKEKGLLHAVISTGNCFGGDVEAPNIYSGLLCGGGADILLCGIGPGIVGTATPYGHGGMSAAFALNAACALGGDPVLAPRISSADPRRRHRGISHHMQSVLRATLEECRVALPESAGDLTFQELPERHGYLRTPYTASGLEERFGLTFESMGRGYRDDPVFFDAAAGAVALALEAR
jgi:hypothetical protein